MQPETTQIQDKGNAEHHSLVHRYYDKLLAAIIEATRSVSTHSSLHICEIKQAVHHAISTVLRKTVNEHELLCVLDEMLTLSGKANVGVSAGKTHHHHTHHHAISAVGEHFSNCMVPDVIGAVGTVHMGDKERQIVESLVKDLGESLAKLKEEDASSHSADSELPPHT